MFRCARCFHLLYLSAYKKNALLSRDPIQILRDLGNFKIEHLSEEALIIFCNSVTFVSSFPIEIIQK